MAVPPLLLNQINAACGASTIALGALDDLLYTIDPDDDDPLENFHATILNVRTYVNTAVQLAQDSINTINNLSDEGVDLPDYITEQNIQEIIHELPNIMNRVMQEYQLDNKPNVVDHLSNAKDNIEFIDDWCRMIIQHAEQPQDDSNNGSNGSSNVSYGSNESNGGRRKKRTLRKRRSHSKKRKQTRRKRTHRKRTHSKRTNRKRTHRK